MNAVFMCIGFCYWPCSPPWLTTVQVPNLSELEADALPPTPAHSARATGEGGSEASQEAPSSPRSCAQAIAVLDTIPGVDQRSAELLVAEWGTDTRRFGTASRLSARTGVALGNDESAGKIRQGNRTRRTGLPQMAHAAARTKSTYVSALGQRLAARRGKKRAIMAVARAIVVSASHRLARHKPYHALGHNDLDEQQRVHLVDRVRRRIERLGYRVSLDPGPAA
jgi:transposase